VRKHQTTKDVKLAYQHLGGLLANLPSARQMMIETTMVEEFNSTILADAGNPPTHLLISDGTKNQN